MNSALNLNSRFATAAHIDIYANTYYNRTLPANYALITNNMFTQLILNLVYDSASAPIV